MNVRYAAAERGSWAETLLKSRPSLLGFSFWVRHWVTPTSFQRSKMRNTPNRNLWPASKSTCKWKLHQNKISSKICWLGTPNRMENIVYEQCVIIKVTFIHSIVIERSLRWIICIAQLKQTANIHTHINTAKRRETNTLKPIEEVNDVVECDSEEKQIPKWSKWEKSQNRRIIQTLDVFFSFYCILEYLFKCVCTFTNKCWTNCIYITSQNNWSRHWSSKSVFPPAFFEKQILIFLSLCFQSQKWKSQ